MTNKHHGSCLCGDVAFGVDVDVTKGSRCNCTTCTKLGATTSIVKPAAFTLRTPEAQLSSFTRSPEVGARYFCARCHTYCFGKGHLDVLGGDFVSVNLHCLDGYDATRTEIVYWDGRHDNWAAGPRPSPWPITGAQA
ncbi:MAG TPA: hypothetical protein VK427_25245 [Kofleriaceae bacterium]|nr:hypothetical protein [Kofleriaceae bacterium]